MTLDFITHTKDMDQSKPGMLFASFQRLLETSSDMIFVKDMNLTYVAGTQSFAEMVGKSSMAEVLGRTDYEAFEDKELSKRYTADDRKLLDGGKDLIDYVEPLTDENGEARYSTTSKYILRDENGNPVGLLGVSRDITKELKAEQHYHQEIEYLFTLPEDTYTAIFIDVTDWRIISQRSRPEMRGKIPMMESMEFFLAVAQGGVCGQESEAYRVYRDFSQAFLSERYDKGETDYEMEYQRTLADGNAYWVRDEWKLMTDPRTGHLTLMLLVKDIHSRKLAERELEQAASTDPLTGLLNRAVAQQQIQEYLTTAGSEGVHAVYMIDLDDFKQVNDTFGHQEGDAVLKAMAQGIRGCFRETDIVARIGGDEFFVFAKNMPEQNAIVRAEQLLRMAQETCAGNASVNISISVGVSMYPRDGRTLDELYAKADGALYKAKGLGKNRAAFATGEPALWKSAAYAKQYDAYNTQVVDHSNSICYITDIDNYELLHLTKAGMDIHGMKGPEDYLGKKCYKAIMGLDEPCPFCPNSKLREGQEYRWERYNEHIGKWFDRTSTFIRLNGRNCHLEIARDVTARKEEISLLPGQLTMEDILFRCLHTLTFEKDMDTAVNLFLEAIGGYYQADRTYIFEMDDESQTIRSSFEWCADGVPARFDSVNALPLERVRIWLDKLETGGEFSVSALEDELDVADPLYLDLKADGVHSILMAPLLQNGRIAGLLGVNNPQQKEGNLVLLRSVAGFAQAELERRRLVAELEYMSFTDTLTGLKNRNQFLRVLKAYDFKMPKTIGVIIVDINGLKVINDTHSQSFGDHILRRVGQVVTETVSGSVFRIGGGEFAAICENIGKDAFQQAAVALRSAFDSDRDYSVSIGCAWSEETEDVNALMKQAEELLHADKRSYYHTVLREGRSEASPGSFTSEVLKEVKVGRFVVYYQPQVDIKTGNIIGAEALVRKIAEDGRLIPPNKFIPFYEMEGVVGLVDMFVLDTACATLRRWLDAGYNLHLSVNFSRVTLLETGIVGEMARICRRHSVPTSAITIEVTESISKMDHEQLKQLIQTINGAGFTISLDDFGSQYSNLAILSAMDFDEIKFDRSLVKALEHNRKSQVVMANSVRMCHDLEGTSSLAEGIETKGQLDLLLDYKCDYGQGYYFSKPLPVEEFDRKRQIYEWIEK